MKNFPRTLCAGIYIYFIIRNLHRCTTEESNIRRSRGSELRDGISRRSPFLSALRLDCRRNLRRRARRCEVKGNSNFRGSPRRNTPLSLSLSECGGDRIFPSVYMRVRVYVCMLYQSCFDEKWKGEEERSKLAQREWPRERVSFERNSVSLSWEGGARAVTRSICNNRAREK